MPEGDAIILIWIQLLCLAGKTNDNGAVYIGQHMNYTDEMISTICNQPLNTVRLALKTFEQFEMINLGEDGLISIANWEKHQNIEGMEKVREQTRKRVAKYRAKQKELESSNVNVTLRNGTDKNKNRIDKNRLDIDKNTNNSHVDDEDFKTQIINTWNSLDKNIPRIQTLNTNTQRYQMLRARINEHGLDTVIKAIKSIDNSKFLKGYVSDFRITIDWFIKPNNFIKVLEGNYKDKVTSNNADHSDYAQKAREERFRKMLES